MSALWIAIFAPLGALARYYQSNLVAGAFGKSFPYATLSINVIGSFLMGLLFYFTLDRLSVSPSIRAGVLTGFLGAYTTFSTFSIETLSLFQEGKVTKAISYSLMSVILGLGAVYLGSVLGKK
ncbi:MULTISPECIES: fluoride efflux transporter CrcB [Acidithrix]|uniref:Fluoride-specific ion channel FluC n=1 Tax=Acidithrix ferrooxidans TaxID=1280514 RepID=A0A0D8HKQ5_9ACTN|nr:MULTISPECIES: fluoride efflux transporter CrcB [Acidithrix]KJF18459.1 putative fluoride ion transporter CrcB [Acidithrix ferrooxidans]